MVGTARDSAYLANEANYRWLEGFESKNLLDLSR
jgi:hypothetical protein